MLPLQVVTVVLVASAAALSGAHALEFPGKLRLSKEDYFAVQPIYYPGFTIGGGIAEAGGLVATLLLALLTAGEGAASYLTWAAFGTLVAMHAAYWLLVHPVNNFWLRDFELQGVGAKLFAFDPLRRNIDSNANDWTRLRDRWEWSHVVRAVLGLAGLILLVTAVAI